MNPSVPADTWRQRIDPARRRRDQNKTRWHQYARLHTDAYLAAQQQNDDVSVTLPEGDQVKLSLVHRNVEQTMALMEITEVTISAKAQDINRGLGREDAHRELVVGTALSDSLRDAGLLGGEEASEMVKLDAVIVGHGPAYHHWRTETVEVEGPPVLRMQETEDGVIEPLLDDNGLPQFEYPMIERVVYDGMRDMRVSPLAFLFEPTADAIASAAWHGMEQVADLDELKADPRYDVPDWVQPSAYYVEDLYGDEPSPDEVPDDVNQVMTIVVYDKRNRELITFIENRPDPRRAPTEQTSGPPQADLVVIALERFPLTFDHPEHSPFTALILTPANDWPFGISQIEHIRNTAVEADKLRTRQANLTRQIKRIIGYRKGSGIDVEQLEAARTRPDFSFVGFDVADDTRSLEELWSELPLPRVHPELFQGIEEAKNDVRQTTGVSDVPLGGADTATETEAMMQIGGARTNRKRQRYLDWIARVSEVHRAFMAQWAPQGQTITVQGADGVPLTLRYGREAFSGRYNLKANPGGALATLSPVQQKLMAELSSMFMGRFGPEFDLVWMRQILTFTQVRDVEALMLAARRGLMGGQAAAPDNTGAGSYNTNDYSDPQAMRAAINTPNEGAMIRARAAN